MSRAGLVITAVTVEKRPVAEVVTTYGVSRAWPNELLARYRAEVVAASEPHSRAPTTSPGTAPPQTVDLVLRLRKQLLEAAHDAGIRHHVEKSGAVTLRTAGRLRHIGIGRAHRGIPVILLIQDLDVRVVNAITGELLRELTVDPTKDYQPRTPE